MLMHMTMPSLKRISKLVFTLQVFIHFCHQNFSINHRQSPPEPTEISSPTPTPLIPFPGDVLTSSPVDVYAINVANTALDNMIQSGQPISTPGKKYFNCLICSSNCLRTKNAILQQEKEALQAVVTARRKRLSGKRKAIGDESLLTTVKMLNDVQETEP